MKELNAFRKFLNEAKPNLKKALPKIAARNVERNNIINLDIESMMDMVGETGKDENSEEAKILFRASNASGELEQALTDLQIHFEDDLDEGKALDEVIEEAADDDIDDNVKLIAAHMSTQEALEKLVAEFDLLLRTEHCPGGKAEIGRTLRNVVADNKLN